MGSVVLSTLFLIAVFSLANAKTVGKILDENLQQLRDEIKTLKAVYGDCAPCFPIVGSKTCDCRNLPPKEDCLEYRQAGIIVNGLYRVSGSKFASQNVYCDQTTQGGGWTVIQRRKDGSENFYRNWNDYKNGFGKLDGEFWFGNDNIHELTSGLQTNTLLVNLKIKGESKPVWAKYDKFAVGNEASKFQLKVSGFTGNTTDAITIYNNQRFTTYDQDNDGYSRNCAKLYKGGWWYENCHNSNLNGLYQFISGDCQTITWPSGCKTHATFTEMKVRRNT